MKQCSGFGSASGSVCFWASWIRILILNLFVRIRIKKQKKEMNLKNLDFYCFKLFYDFLSLKNDV
jgi:hypothetical protein